MTLEELFEAVDQLSLEDFVLLQQHMHRRVFLHQHEIVQIMLDLAIKSIDNFLNMPGIVEMQRWMEVVEKDKKSPLYPLKDDFEE